MTGLVIETPDQEPKNLTCSNDEQCVDKMQSCNVFCHVDDFQIGDNKQGSCIEMNYVDNGMYPECG